MLLATRRPRFATSLVLAAFAVGWLAFSAGATHAAPNTPPGVDHYLVYKVLNPPTFSTPLVLSDQFIQNASCVTFTMDFFMCPVDKNGEHILDPALHYTWWKTSTQPFGAKALVLNQFRAAEQPLDVFQPQYLLNPALKYLTPPQPPLSPIPTKNHYEAYDCAGDPVEIPVSLVDQFGPTTALVHFPRWLAPPVQKIFAGALFPIVDPVPHLVIYDITVQTAQPPPPVFVQDEFGIWQLELGPRIFLAVPSYKTGVVDTKPTSWGRLKTLYR